MSPVVLASASPRRRELLAALGVAADVAPTHVEEWEDPAADPAALVAENARRKALAAARLHPGRVVLAADTTVALGPRVLNKPADLADARAMLRALAGREHAVHTALAVVQADGSLRADAVTATVRFRAYGDDAIDAYFARGNPLDKAGAYGIQECRALLVAGWDGPFTTIVGLPLAATAALLRAAGVAVGPVPAEPSPAEILGTAPVAVPVA